MPGIVSFDSSSWLIAAEPLRPAWQGQAARTRREIAETDSLSLGEVGDLSALAQQIPRQIGAENAE